MKRQAIAEALRDAIAEEMERDEAVSCIGEDIAVPGAWGGPSTVTLGLEKRFPDRMINTPIAELGFWNRSRPIAQMWRKSCKLRVRCSASNNCDPQEHDLRFAS